MCAIPCAQEASEGWLSHLSRVRLRRKEAVRAQGRERAPSSWLCGPLGSGPLGVRLGLSPGTVIPGGCSCLRASVSLSVSGSA